LYKIPEYKTGKLEHCKNRFLWKGMEQMKITQQKLIKSFLTEEFGKDKGRLLFDRQENTLNKLIENPYSDHSSACSIV